MKLTEVYKAAAAFVTSFVGLEGLAASIDASYDHPWVHALALGIAAVTGGATWFVRNKATFDQIILALDEDPALEEEVATTVVGKAIAVNPDVVEELIRRYRASN